MEHKDKHARHTPLLIYLIIAILVVQTVAIVYFFSETNSSILSLKAELAPHSASQPPASQNSTPSSSLLPEYLSTNATFGRRLTNISKPINSTDLAIINNAPNSYFETAGEMLLNGTIQNYVSNVPANKSNQYPPLIIDGKPSVVYVGATSCVFCGEGRWAMALALSRFGNFSSLYKGYSSFGDHDLPTLYWAKDNYTIQSGVGYGNSYSSKYINFISSDYESPIIQGFVVKPLTFFIQNAPNSTYLSALQFMNSTGKFSGTPFMFWGTTIIDGTVGEVFGNTTPTTILPLEYETHAQVFAQLKNFNDQFSWSEYAAADVYAAHTCGSINNTASFCSLPAIKSLEKQMNVT